MIAHADPAGTPRSFEAHPTLMMRLAALLVVATLGLASCAPCVTNGPEAQAPYAAAYSLSTPQPHPAPADPAGAELRLHGTWRADGTVDGLELAMATDARIDEDARTGGYVQARGVIGEDSHVRVERIRGR